MEAFLHFQPCAWARQVDGFSFKLYETVGVLPVVFRRCLKRLSLAHIAAALLSFCHISAAATPISALLSALLTGQLWPLPKGTSMQLTDAQFDLIK